MALWGERKKQRQPTTKEKVPNSFQDLTVDQY
jgi:hypothetical protein